MANQFRFHLFLAKVEKVVNCLDESSSPKEPLALEMVLSVGRIQGDELVVESPNFTQAVLLTHVGDLGVLHSHALKLFERYSVDPETGSLIIRWEATDPNYFSVPICGG